MQDVDNNHIVAHWMESFRDVLDGTKRNLRNGNRIGIAHEPAEPDTKILQLYRSAVWRRRLKDISGLFALTDT
jgi:hypothetical protein